MSEGIGVAIGCTDGQICRDVNNEATGQSAKSEINMGAVLHPGNYYWNTMWNFLEFCNK